jgi:hypothetical protein
MGSVGFAGYIRPMEGEAGVVDLTGWRPAEEEALGARDKDWMTVADGDGVSSWLFKRPRRTGLPELRADLWAEVIAFGIATAVGVPAAEARFAVSEGQRGVISRRIEGDLAHGNELLSALNPEYPTAGVGRVPGYDLDAIEDVLRLYAGSEEGMTAFESFAGYLAFDALISNTDRHHENWAVIRTSGRLAPTYDHGASLGFNVPERRRADPSAAAARARARHFPEFGSLAELAHSALMRLPQVKRDLWLWRMSSLTSDQLREVIDEVPSSWMSESARTFVFGLVQANQRRLTP